MNSAITSSPPDAVYNQMIIMGDSKKSHLGGFKCIALW